MTPPPTFAARCRRWVRARWPVAARGPATAGLAVAAAIVAGQLAVLGAPVVAASLIALFRKDTKDAVKRIGALTDLIDKLR